MKELKGNHICYKVLFLALVIVGIMIECYGGCTSEGLTVSLTPNSQTVVTSEKKITFGVEITNSSDTVRIIPKITDRNFWHFVKFEVSHSSGRPANTGWELYRMLAFDVRSATDVITLNQNDDYEFEITLPVLNSGLTVDGLENECFIADLTGVFTFRICIIANDKNWYSSEACELELCSSTVEFTLNLPQGAPPTETPCTNHAECCATPTE